MVLHRFTNGTEWNGKRRCCLETIIVTEYSLYRHHEGSKGAGVPLKIRLAGLRNGSQRGGFGSYHVHDDLHLPYTYILGVFAVKEIYSMLHIYMSRERDRDGERKQGGAYRFLRFLWLWDYLILGGRELFGSPAGRGSSNQSMYVYMCM